MAATCCRTVLEGRFADSSLVSSSARLVARILASVITVPWRGGTEMRADLASIACLMLSDGGCVVRVAQTLRSLGKRTAYRYPPSESGLNVGGVRRLVSHNGKHALQWTWK